MANERGFIFTDPQEKVQYLKGWCDHFDAVGRKWWILEDRQGWYVLFREGERLVSDDRNHGRVSGESVELETLLNDGYKLIT